MLAKRFVGENDSRRDVVRELIAKLAEIAITANLPTKAVLAFGRNGELLRADFAQGNASDDA